MGHRSPMCERHSLADLSRVAQEAGGGGSSCRAYCTSSGEFLGQGGWHSPQAPLCTQLDESLSCPWALVDMECHECSVAEQSEIFIPISASREHRHCGPDTSCFLLFPPRRARDPISAPQCKRLVRISGATETEKDRQRRCGLISASLCQ